MRKAPDPVAHRSLLRGPRAPAPFAGARRVRAEPHRTGSTARVRRVRRARDVRAMRCRGHAADVADFECPRCATVRPPVCLRCHSTRFKNLRAGVTRVREELEALAGEAVVDVTADVTTTLPPARVHVGTEAALHRVDEADAVAFLDFDQELLAPRYRASEEAFALLARAARLVGGRRPGPGCSCRPACRTTRCIDAALHADPDRVARRGSAATSRPPLPAGRSDGRGLRRGRGRARSPRCGSPLGIEVLGPAKGTWLVRAATPEALADALAAHAASVRRACASRSTHFACDREAAAVSLGTWLRTRSGSSATRC